MNASVIVPAFLRTDGRNGWRVRFYLRKKRRELYLAGVSKKVAETVAYHCGEIAGALSANTKPAPESAAWANGTEGNLRENLVAWEMADPMSPRLKTDAGRYLGAYLDAYIAGRTDVKPNTIIAFKQARRELCNYFGERCVMRSILLADASRWRNAMLAKPLSIASVSLFVKKAKTMFAEALRGLLLTESPFANLKGGNEANPSRQRFIDRATADKVLNACPDADWRVIFALCRFGGLRCPSEVRSLRWVDIDSDEGRLRIDSPKTGLRFCPLFPELRAVLSDAWHAAPEGAVYCVGRYRDGESNLRSQLGRILERAGVAPWPKLFQNLRSTRRTELQEQFPSHVIDVWLGHSTKVAERHYLQVTDEHWGRAIDSRSPIANGALSIATTHDMQKPLENMLIDALQGLAMGAEISPGGIEPPTRL